MPISEICSRNPHVALRDEPLAHAARTMIRHAIGALVVVDPRGASSVPAGMITDRDVLCGQITKRADIFCLTVADVMSPHPLTLPQSTGIDEAIRLLGGHGLRRAPIVDASGALVGLLSFDDLLAAVADDVRSLARLIGLHARGTARQPAPTT